MNRLYTIARKLTLYILTMVLVSSAPMAALAEGEPTTEVTPPPEPTYTYDPATGRWNTDSWQYNPVTNQYEKVVTPPEPVQEVVQEPVATTETTVDNTTTNENDINHEVDAQAVTGNATVDSNLTAGSATSGDAATIATILNNLNSVSALSGVQPVTFTSDIYGDVYGDIQLAPELLKAMAEHTVAPSGNQTINYNVVNNTNLNNDVDLSALSGDASVLKNTQAGSATSGDATAIANILNIVNSVISANRSFVGTINIHGNLDGDILLSQEGKPSLIASNAESSLSPGNLIVNQTNLVNILNQVNLDASSGAATVSSNTNAGNATSGDADTNLVIMDLVGMNVVAKNSLLVFVNVLGKWVGIIVDAPTGATAAVLGDDVASQLVALQGDTTIDVKNQTNITNNVNVSAHTGGATVAGNTNAGDATTGDAKAAATILNMANSAFSVSDWFGVLFINVLGSWYGSFGVDTPQGDEVTTSSPPPTSEQPEGVSAPAQVFRFISHSITGGQEAPSSPEPVVEEVASTGLLAASDHSTSSPVSVEASANPLTISMPVAAAILAGLTIGTMVLIRLIGAARSRFTHIP